MSVFKVNGFLIRAGEEITNPIGQSSARWQVLGRAYEPTTVAKIAQDIGHARQSVQRQADILAAEGLISYQDNPADRRARFLALTSDGAEVLSQIYQRQVEWSLRIMTELTPNQLARLANALEGVAQVLDDLLWCGRRERSTFASQAGESQEEASSMKGSSQMGRYVVLYEAPLGVAERFAQATPEEAAAGVQLWVDWAQKIGPGLVDPGKPLGNAVRVSTCGSGHTDSNIIGMSILQAESMDGALSMVNDHHHLHWAEDCEIVVLEEMPIPEDSNQ